MQRAAIAPLSIALLVMPALAHAQASCPPDHVGCERSDVDFEHSDALFDSVMLDSGWVPAGAPVQVRFALFLGGSTEVDLGGTAVTSWPSALDVAVPGRPGTGRFAIDYGIEIVARVRIDVTIAGVHYREEVDIPIPGGIPRDLRVAATSTFDPFVLPPSEPRPILAWDDTERVRVLEVDVTDALIPIPGIGGGFAFEAVAELEGRYQTDRIAITDALTAITEENASVIVRADPGAAELGAAKDYTVLPHGTIAYDGVITIFPTLFVEIVGRRFDLTLAEVPLNVVDLTASTDFDAAPVHVPLPDIRLEETTVAFGELMVGEMLERIVTVHNDGESELRVSVSDPSAPFAASSPSLAIPPRSSERLAVRFAPSMGGDESALLILDSNDPDEPRVTIRLSGGALGFDMPDAGLGDAGIYDDAGPGFTTEGGCGCRTAGHTPSSPWPGMLVGVGALAVLRRRRR